MTGKNEQKFGDMLQDLFTWEKTENIDVNLLILNKIYILILNKF